MITADRTAAILVTRGDTDLAPIIATFPTGFEIVVWNNSIRPNQRTLGRHTAAAALTDRPIVVTQDDDHVFTGWDALLEAYEPGKITANMDEGWVRRRGYEDMAMFGKGAVYDREIPERYLGLYLERHPFDEFFQLYCDVILGVLAPTKRVDIGCVVELESGYAPNRMNAAPDFEEMKDLAKSRARAIRAELGLPV